MTVLETVQRFTPLGVAFWDPVTDAPVTDGLVVSVRPTGSAGRFRRGVSTPRGVHALFGIPGLRDVELRRQEPGGRGEVEDLPSGPVVEVDVLVEDRLGRFLPTVVRLLAPRKGVATAADAFAGCAALAASFPDEVPMFLLSAPGRSVPPSTAVVRACLRDRASGAPARHAMLVVEAAGQRTSGAADGDGNAVVVLPYPRFDAGTPPASTPAGSHGIPTDEQHWPVTVRARWEPDALSYPAGVRVPRAHTLFCQRPALLVADDGNSAAPELAADLGYGRELLLRTAGVSDPDRASYLYVEPAR